MANVYPRNDTGKLVLDFKFMGKRCREHTALKDTKANRAKAMALLEKVEAEITLGTFDYAKYFPNSQKAKEFDELQRRFARAEITEPTTPLFSKFAELWFSEMCILWRSSHISKTRITLDLYLLQKFGKKEVGCITKAEILEFRGSLAKVTTRSNKPLSPARINQIMTPLRMILNEAANRYNFNPPYVGIKSLPIPRSNVQPFSLEEVQLIIQSVRPDFKNYYIVRFFTGMRTAEIDGLQWQFVDFKRKQVLIEQTIVNGEVQPPKNDGSFRTISMNDLVYKALKEQKKVTGKNDYVFCTSVGTPLQHNNVTKRVWYPLLSYLGLNKRNPYQTRHTAATLWLASGESPEWIARQMGHSTTEMLFRVYSRYVPNLTRQDGSAFDRLIKRKFGDSSIDNSRGGENV